MILQIFADLQYMARTGVRHGNNAGLRRQSAASQPDGLRVLPVSGAVSSPDRRRGRFSGRQADKGVFALNGPALAAGG